MKVLEILWSWFDCETPIAALKPFLDIYEIICTINCSHVVAQYHDLVIHVISTSTVNNRFKCQKYAHTQKKNDNNCCLHRKKQIQKNFLFIKREQKRVQNEDAEIRVAHTNTIFFSVFFFRLPAPLSLKKQNLYSAHFSVINVFYNFVSVYYYYYIFFVRSLYSACRTNCSLVAFAVFITVCTVRVYTLQQQQQQHSIGNG